VVGRAAGESHAANKSAATIANERMRASVTSGRSRQRLAVVPILRHERQARGGPNAPPMERR
jgi:hypothetical protein